MKNFESIIKDKLESIKNDLKHKKIGFSRVENNFSFNKNIKKENYLLSIILAGDFIKDGMDEDLENITEIVIDVLVETNITTNVKVDLSYGNGIIIKEIIIENVDMDNKEYDLIAELDTNFFNSIQKDIYNSLYDLKMDA